MKRTNLHFTTVVILLFTSLSAIAQENDHLFVLKGRFSATVSTGIPYLGMAEIGYGISRRVSVGVIAGHTPNVAGYGVRIRALLYQKNENFRVYFRMPILYYPKTDRYGDEPWMLTWPVVNADWKLTKRGTLTAGVGVVEAHRVSAMLGKSEVELEAEWDIDCPGWENMEGNDFNAGWWNTFQIGYAHPIGQKMSFSTEVAAVMKGFKLAGSDYVGGPPVILVLGFTRNF